MKNIPKDFVFRKNPKVFNFKFGLISTAELRNIDGQRLPKEPKVNKIISNFDYNLVNVVKVSDRDGMYRIFDGDNTCIALKRMNGDKDCMVWCKVFTGMDESDERYYFVMQNGIADDPTFNENLYALHVDKNPSVMKYEEILRRHDFDVDFRAKKSADRTPTCHKTLYNAYLADKGAFEDTVRILSNTYADKEKGLHKDICAALFRFVYTYRDHDNYSSGRLTAVLRSKANSPEIVLAKSKSRVGEPKYKVAREILVRYNKNAKSDEDRLPDIFGQE